MEVSRQQVQGSAAIQGDLWGARAQDFADIQEGFTLRLGEAVLDKLDLSSNMNILDVGCGAGGFCRQAASRGAKVAGLDAAAALIEIARQRTPHGDFRVGEMEQLPYPDHSFEVVTGFNSFQYAANQVNALSEARRVCKAVGKVIIAVWGRAEHCEAAGCLIKVLGSLLPPPPPGAPGPFALSQEVALEALVTQAGLQPLEGAWVTCMFDYPDLETALRGLLSGGPVVKAIRHSSEEAARQAVAESIAPFKTKSGGYHLENEFRYLVTMA